MKHLFLIILLLKFISVSAQENLIRNPSFEEYVYDPNDPVIFHPLEKRYWLRLGSTDYFMPLFNSVNFGTPDNYFGTQIPKDGFAYVGIGNASSSAGLREYIQGQLTKTLVKNKTYCFTSFLSVPDSFQYSSRNFSIFFNHNDIIYSTTGIIDSIPSIVDKSCYTNNYDDWFLFKGNYVAKGFEQKITLGHFFPNGIDTFKMPSTNSNNSLTMYYYIDDLSLYEINTYQGPTDTIIKMLPPFSYSLQAKQHSNTKYLWSTGDTTLSTTIAADGMYTLQSITECGMGLDTFYVHFEDATIIPPDSTLGNTPNVLSIGSDTINGSFYTKNLPRNCSLLIYNRWGVLIYSTGNYSNDWKGTSNDNKPIDTGTYYYILSIPNNPTRKGFIEVLR
jgi:gliding motility-associated-like protein